MDRSTVLVAAVHGAWCACSLALGETPVPWDAAPEWRKSALQHTLGFWESWDNYGEIDIRHFCSVTHFAWANYHRRNHWTYSDLTPFAQLEPAQQKKLEVMFRAYVFFREILGPPHFG